MPDRNLAADFFIEFPEYTNSVAFTCDTGDVESLLERIGSLDQALSRKVSEFLDSSLPHRNICIPLKVRDEQFFIVHLIDDYDYSLSIDWPLHDDKDDRALFDDIIAHHEKGHVLLSFKDPYDFQSANTLLRTDRDDVRTAFAEEFCDCYAALRRLRDLPDNDFSFIQRLADLRVLSAVRKEKTDHLTHSVLDALYGLCDSDFLAFLRTMSPKEVVDYTFEFTQKHGLSVPGRNKFISECRDSLFSPSPIPARSYARLSQAISRQVRVSDNDIDTYVDRYGFQKGDLSQAFMRSGLLKALVALKIPLVTAEDMHDVSTHIASNIITSGTKTSSDLSNKFLGLDGFVRTARDTFYGDRFALMNAASSPDFVNDLAEKYLGQFLLEQLSESPEL